MCFITPLVNDLSDKPITMEKLMQYVWNHRLWPLENLHTVDGRRIQIIDPGRLNTHSGPDFFNAKVKIDGELWVGNIEMHVAASDWHRHKHDTDPAYDNVVLHVVDRNDTCIRRRSDGAVIPQMVMQCAPDLSTHYSSLVTDAPSVLTCRAHLTSIEPVFMRQWLDSLCFARLHTKSDRIEAYRKRFGGDWEQAAFITVARSLGVGINGDVFERMACSIPLRAVSRHNDSLLITEAFVFGQSGLLDTAPNNHYTALLKREYAFICAKFGLRQPQGMLWKMARMRPASFPYRRLAFLAQMLHRSARFMSHIAAAGRTAEPLKAFREMFTAPITGFWSDHYTFEDSGATSQTATAPQVGAVTVQTLIINAVVPLLYAYGTTHSDHQLTDTAIELLQAMPPERNSIVRMFTDVGVPCCNAADSQALVELRRSYCEERKCLYCHFGHRLLQRRAIRDTLTAL